MFCHDLNLTDDWTLATQSQERANYQFALYATHLATGSSIYSRSIKAATITSYLADVAKFIGRFRDIDPRYVSSTDTKLAPVISKVLAEQRRWESVPNRREPFTLAMYAHIAAVAATSPDSCSLENAMANWTLCNPYAGCRGIEWAQSSTTSAPLYAYHRNRFDHAYAFTLADVRCTTAAEAHITTVLQAVATPTVVGNIHLRFEEQKNGNNGEWKLFVRNTDNPALCFVTSFLNILARFFALIGPERTEFPLSIYRTVNGSNATVLNITTADVERSLRAAASTLFNLHPIVNKRELQLWSAHSLRVGACATLYSNGFTEMEIKFLLRWKSNAFMTYLRNLAVTSRRHNAAMNDVRVMPNLTF